ncbi:cobyric acid synthase [Candidatus Methylobacter oryzae]|uniref:Cobyric acid synthase n=1 Tax=Candidatus Methylobacter oryzae TaxID=2497749 RepID=A0ABY3C7F8_9GAMM|nr:cobyric acid synthase [Candidatus Methylobacter oryzae]TRW91988.1 cobyric acid synthase [Candidatus Methylobacter oryzae]
MKPLAIFGTSSDAGKTTLVMALCRIFADQGLKVAPFKAQNVSNNSAVTKEGREISRAQCLQAEAARVEPSYLFNPVLLKSHGNGSVQVIVNGLVYQNQSIAAYYAEIDGLKEQVKQAFSQLQQDYDLIVAEGAGSPVELNLLDKDLSNTFVANSFNTKNILVADIERGGVFASIYGTLELMDPVMRGNLIGVVVNKFRGDRRFFDEGEKIIAERFGVPVLGVLPFTPLNIDMEDSQSLRNYRQRLHDAKIRIAVIGYPGLSNYNDLDALMADPELYVELIHDYRPLSSFDMVLLPGSKTVIRDLQWLKKQGLFEEIQRLNKPAFGICGGYQMFCGALHDPDAIEHETAIVEPGFAFIDDTVLYQRPKILARGQYRLFSYDAIGGYEIHCGRIDKYPLYFQGSRFSGTHVHGIFDNDAFRTDYFKTINPRYRGYAYSDYREAEIQGFADMVGQNLDIAAILQALQAD